MVFLSNTKWYRNIFPTHFQSYTLHMILSPQVIDKQFGIVMERGERQQSLIFLTCFPPSSIPTPSWQMINGKRSKEDIANFTLKKNEIKIYTKNKFTFSRCQLSKRYYVVFALFHIIVLVN